MSLTKEGFERASERLHATNELVNPILARHGIARKNVVGMNHYGALYLFGKHVGPDSPESEIVQIIKKTKSRDIDGGHIDAFGKWRSAREVRREQYDLDNPEKADKRRFKMIMKRARKGDTNAMHLIHELYANGIGVKQDLKKSEKWLLKSMRGTSGHIDRAPSGENPSEKFVRGEKDY